MVAIEKYDSKGERNYFLSEEQLIKKCHDKYNQMMEDEDAIGKLSFVESLLPEEIERRKKG